MQLIVCASNRYPSAKTDIIGASTPRKKARHGENAITGLLIPRAFLLTPRGVPTFRQTHPSPAAPALFG